MPPSYFVDPDDVYGDKARGTPLCDIEKIQTIKKSTDASNIRDMCREIASSMGVGRDSANDLLDSLFFDDENGDTYVRLVGNHLPHFQRDLISKVRYAFGKLEDEEEVDAARKQARYSLMYGTEDVKEDVIAIPESFYAAKSVDGTMLLPEMKDVVNLFLEMENVSHPQLSEWFTQRAVAFAKDCGYFLVMDGKWEYPDSAVFTNMLISYFNAIGKAVLPDVTHAALVLDQDDLIWFDRMRGSISYEKTHSDEYDALQS